MTGAAEHDALPEAIPDTLADLDPRIATASAYRPPELPHRRVLVMRRWPRGVARARIDEWLRELGPSDALLQGYRAGEVDWSAFASAYLAEVASQAESVDRLARMAREGGVVLLCGSHWPCHRALLAPLVGQRLADLEGRGS